MHFKINQIDFQKSIRSIMPAVGAEGKADIASFRFIQITVVDGQITFAATNGEVILKCNSVAKTLSLGCIGVAGKALAEIVDLLPSGDVTVQIADEQRLQIRAGRSAFHLPILPGDTFPILPQYETLTYVDAEGFFDDMDFVSFACSKSLDRPSMQGVLLNQGEIVGLDGHRLAIRKTKWGFEHVKIIPADSLNKIKRTFPDPIIGVCIAENEIHFSQNGKYGTVRLIRGHPYPDYIKVIPSDECSKVQVNAAALLNALKMVTVVADKQNSVVLNFKPGLLYLYAESAERGKAEDTIEIVCDKELSVGMNADYLKQALERTDGAEVTIELRNSNKAIVLREGNNIHVVMPKRI